MSDDKQQSLMNLVIFLSKLKININPMFAGCHTGTQVLLKFEEFLRRHHP